MRAEELVLISVDDHICEPADMFDEHVPARYRDRAPRVVDEPDGSQQWYFGDVRGRNLGLNAVALHEHDRPDRQRGQRYASEGERRSSTGLGRRRGRRRRALP